MKEPLRRAFAGLWQGALDTLPAVVQTPESTAGRSKGRRRGYASGTDNASPGVALVGENGPELVYFHGGERVLTAGETATRAQPLSALTAPASGPGSVNVQFSVLVEGNASLERSMSWTLRTSSSRSPSISPARPEAYSLKLPAASSWARFASCQLLTISSRAFRSVLEAWADRKSVV